MSTKTTNQTSRASRGRRPAAGRLGLAAAVVAAAALGHAGRADQGLTLTTIAVDGQFADWAAVLANPRQATRDGDGSSYTQAECARFSTDRDCSLTGGSGNDFLTFAWTYDSSAVYLYIERYGSPTNGVDLLFVADVNGDKKLDATHDRVIHAHWNGNTGVVGLDWSPYVPLNPAGDDLVCVPVPPATLCLNPAGVPAAPAGYVDGYKLPGSNPQVNACAGCSGRGNTTAGDPLKGLQVELRIPWANFGIATPQPFFWHAVSSNNATLASAVDNIGAPDGKLGSFFYRAASLGPDRGGSLLSPGSATYDHVLANDGNAQDVFDLTARSSLGARLELLDGTTVVAVDETGDGTWESVLAGYDSNGNGKPDFTLAAGASRPLSIRVVMPSGRSGQDVTRLTALSAGDATVSATATDTSMVGAPALVPASQSRGTVAGQPVPYPVTLINAEAGADTFDFSVSAGCPGWRVELLDDASGSPGALAALDANGDGVWDSVSGSYDSNGNGKPDFGPTAGNGGRKSLWLQLTPPAGTPLGQSCQVALTARSAITGATDASSAAAAVGPPVSFTPSYTFAAGTSKLASPGGAVFFPGVIRNYEAVARSYALSTPSLSPAGLYAPLFWTDPDGDGNPSDGALVTATPSVPPYGGELPVVVEVRALTAAGVPLANGTSVTVQARATPTAGGAAPATQVDEARVGRLAVYSDALLTENVRFFAPCATAYAHAASLAPSDVTRYAITWRDPSGAVVRTVGPWATTARGTADDTLSLAAGAGVGTWTLTLTDAGATLEQIAFTVERAGAFTALATDRARYLAGSPLAVTAAWKSETTSAPLSGTLVRYVVEDQAATTYLDLAGAFHPAPGTTRTLNGVSLAPGESASDGFAVGAASFPSAGHYQVRAEWQLQCGATPLLAGAVAPFDVAPAAPVILQPASGALISTRTPTLAGTAAPGASVTLSDGARSYGPVTADPGGAFAYPLAAGEALADGAHAFTAVQAVNGVVSDASAPAPFTVDATPPAAPAIDPVGSPTRSEPIAVSGTAEAGSTVRLLLDGALAATATASGGAFSASLAGVAEGPHQLAATATDAAGNQGPASPPVAFAVDRTPPAVPTLDAFAAPVAADPVPVSGRTEAAASVELFLDGGGSPAATATADGAGGFAAFLAGLADGAHQVAARATDAAGNRSGTSAPLSFQVDRIPPAAPVLAPVASPTRADPVPVSGAAEPGATVKVFLDGGGSPAATAVADGAGAFAAALAGVVEGTHQLVATATDAAGNGGPPSNLVAFTVDRQAPPAPALAALASPTRADPIAVSGSAEPGATVALFLDGAQVAAATAAGDGSFTASLAGVAEGSHQLTATAADAAGNQGPASAPLSFAVDRTPPPAPAVLSPAEGATLGLSALSGGAATVSGTAEAGAEVSVEVDGAVAGLALAGASGAWSLAVSLADGAHALRARATDAAGNAGAWSPVLAFAVDTLPPATPLLDPPASPTAADPVVLTGAAEPGATVSVILDGAPAAAVTANGGGLFAAALAGVAEGTHQVTLLATDAAGNRSAAGPPSVLVVDRTGPPAPALSVPPATSADPLVVSGTAEPGAALALTLDGASLPPVLADGSGAWSASLSGLAEGQHVLSAVASDAAGNASAAASATFLVDRTAPASPAVTFPADGAAVGLAAAPGGVVPLTGTAEPGSTVEVEVDGAPAGSPLADGAGAWNLPLALADGSHQVRVRGLDAAGNASAWLSLGFTVDTAPPASPAIALPLDGASTAAASALVSGSAEAGATVEVLLGGQKAGQATASASGDWSADVSLPAGDGVAVLTAVAQDAAGNRSAASAPVHLLVDRTVPAPAVLASPTSGAALSVQQVTVSGTAEPGSTVLVSLDGGAPAAVAAAPDGAFSASLPVAEGSHAVAVVVRDAAGNASAASSASFTVDRTAPAAPAVDPIASPTSAAAIPVSGSAEAGAAVSVLVDGVQAATAVADGSGRFAVSLPSVGEGTHQVTVTATDAAGNAATSAPAGVTVDRTAPASPALASPAEGATLAPGTVTVSGAAEPGSTVSASLDGGAAVTAVAAGDGSFSLQVTAAAGGHTLSVTATDAAGNASAPATRSFSAQAAALPPSGGCSCGEGAGTAPWAALALLLVGLRRREPSAAPARVARRRWPGGCGPE